MREAPLAGLRVIDFTWVGAGSLATKLLADFGAEVIKIETATRPDILRLTPPFKDGRRGLNRSGYFSNRNTSKKSVALNLSMPAGVALARRLIALADVVANNFTPGTMEKWGLGYEECRRLRPDLIYLDMPMQGNSGPNSRYMGYGTTIAALSGLLFLTRYPDSPPQGTGTNYPDHVPSPYHAVVALLAALRHRRRTGEGQHIEVSQVESMIAVLGVPVLAALANGADPPARGNRHPAACPHGVYPAAGQDRWIAIACMTEGEWDALAALAGQGWAGDPRFTSLLARLGHQDELDDLIASWTRRQEAFDLAERLQAVGVPAGPVQTPADLLGDPQLRHLGHWITLEHPVMGTSTYDGLAIRLASSPGRVRSPAPLLGQHTREVMTGLLGLSEAEVSALEEEGVLK